MAQVDEPWLRPRLWSWYQRGEDHLPPPERSARSELACFQPPCPGGRLVQIDVHLKRSILDLALRVDDVRHELGWWDMARWHPAALRWEELERIAAYAGPRTPWGVDVTRPDGRRRARLGRRRRNACCSLRNRAHLSGDEGRFPFSAFADLRRALGC